LRRDSLACSLILKKKRILRKGKKKKRPSDHCRGAEGKEFEEEKEEE